MATLVDLKYLLHVRRQVMELASDPDHCQAILDYFESNPDEMTEMPDVYVLAVRTRDKACSRQ